MRNELSWLVQGSVGCRLPRTWRRTDSRWTCSSVTTRRAGYANSFVRNGYEFEASLHALSGIGPEGNRGPCYRLLEACDAARRIEFIPIREIHASHFPDFRDSDPLGVGGRRGGLRRAVSP